MGLRDGQPRMELQTSYNSSWDFNLIARPSQHLPFILSCFGEICANCFCFCLVYRKTVISMSFLNQCVLVNFPYVFFFFFLCLVAFKVEQWQIFFSPLGSKITADGDCSHEIKRRLLLGRKAMTNLESILKSRDITFWQSSIKSNLWFF